MGKLSALIRPLGARLGPFLDLLDARYLPLILVVSPQAWTVYAWLLRDGAPPEVATAGGIGFESIYVGAVAWAERGAGWRAARLPAVTALLFSVAVAVAYYGPAHGPLAVLHAGFPLVGYAYTVMMHAHRAEGPGVAERFGGWVLSVVSAWRGDVPAVSAPVSAPAPLVSAAAEELSQESQAVSARRVSAPAPADNQRARVAALAAERGVSERTIWRRVSKGEIQL